MGVHDEVLERINRRDGVTAGDHHQVGRVQIDADALASDVADKRRKRLRLFGAGFDGEGNADGGGVIAQLAAGGLHPLIGLAGIVLRHDADVRGHDRRAEAHGQIRHQLAGRDFPLVFRLGFKAMAAEIAADCGDDQSPIRQLALRLLDALVREVLIEHIPLGHIHLHALRAQFLRLIERVSERRPKRVGHHADFEVSHVLAILSVF